jgi:hypothetical protein
MFPAARGEVLHQPRGTDSLLLAQRHDIALPQEPDSRLLLPLHTLDTRINRGACDYRRILRPEIRQRGRDPPKRPCHALNSKFCRPAILSAADNQSWPQYHSVLEPQRLDCFLKLALHAHVRKAALRIRRASADEYVCIGTSILRSLRQVEVQVVVDLALCFNAASCRLCSTETREEDLWLHLAREQARPLCSLGRDDGVELGRGSGIGQIASRVGVDRGEGRMREELRENVGALRLSGEIGGTLRQNLRPARYFQRALLLPFLLILHSTNYNMILDCMRATWVSGRIAISMRWIFPALSRSAARFVRGGNILGRYHDGAWLSETANICADYMRVDRYFRALSERTCY